MLTVPDHIYPAVKVFFNDLAPGQTIHRISIYPPQGAEQNSCWANVQAVCKKYGGSPVKGWRIWWIPEIYIEAQAHVVWKTQDGRLVDVTPCEDDQVCLFAEAPAMQENPGDDFVPSRYKNLCGHTVVDEFIQCALVVAQHEDRSRCTPLWLPEPPERTRMQQLLENIQTLVGSTPQTST